jgi:glycosyltransferase involved in cell wall biosynthesis
MRVVLFSRYPKESGRPKGGVESVTVVLVKALAELGDLDVHVLTLEKHRTQAAVERDGAATVHRLPGSKWPQMLDVLAGPGRKRLIRYLTDLEPDVLHVHETYGLGLGAMAIPQVFTVHGFDHANLLANGARCARVRSVLWKCVERRGLAAQRYIISITPYVRHMIEPLTAACIYDIDNPVDERFFSVKGQSEPGRILCTGWINERKNTLGSVEAFARIAADHAEARLIIAGEAPQAEYLAQVKQSIVRHGIADRAEFLGHIDRTRLFQELAKASLFLLPSRQENAPMAIAEAMAAGLPVIVANRCGMPFMVEDGRTGFLIDPESPPQIADRLAQLIGSGQLCREMGQAGREAALQRFHPRAVAEKTAAVYRQISRENRPSLAGSLIQ